MPSRRELPRDMEPNPDDELAETGPTFVFVGHSELRADTEMVALMEAAPHVSPEVARETRLELRDVIVDALDDLDEQEQWIFDSLFVRGMSLRQLSREINMPKTTITRWRDRLLQRLREKLESNPNILDYLEGK